MEDMPYGEHVLQKNLSHGRTFFVGEHALWEDVLLEDVLYKDMSYGRICLPEGYVLQEDIFYWWHALREDMF